MKLSQHRTPSSGIATLVVERIQAARPWVSRVGHGHPFGSLPDACFSLIELLGVVAILAILALALTPLLLQQIDRLAREKEQAVLKQFSTAMQNSIVRMRAIPDGGTWAATIGTELGLNVADVRTNARHLRRVFLIDEGFHIGVNGGGLPYQQTTEGSVITNNSGWVRPPDSPRLILVSSLGSALPASLVNGVLASNHFNAIWNAPENTVPSSTLWTGWAGTGRDLAVERANLSPLFLRLCLTFCSGPAPYQIDNGLTNYDAVNAFFIKGSVVKLMNNNSPPELYLQQVINQDSSFNFERGVWHSSFIQGCGGMGYTVDMNPDLFLRSPWNKNAKDEIRQTNVVNAMSDFMIAYQNWAAQTNWSTVQNPTYDKLTAAQNAMKTNLLYLINNPEEGNCQDP